MKIRPGTDPKNLEIIEITSGALELYTLLRSFVNHVILHKTVKILSLLFFCCIHLENLLFLKLVAAAKIVTWNELIGDIKIQRCVYVVLRFLFFFLHKQNIHFDNGMKCIFV